jgi:hypothetical protein
MISDHGTLQHEKVCVPKILRGVLKIEFGQTVGITQESVHAVYRPSHSASYVVPYLLKAIVIPQALKCAVGALHFENNWADRGARRAHSDFGSI